MPPNSLGHIYKPTLIGTGGRKSGQYDWLLCREPMTSFFARACTFISIISATSKRTIACGFKIPAQTNSQPREIAGVARRNPDPASQLRGMPFLDACLLTKPSQPLECDAMMTHALRLTDVTRFGGQPAVSSLFEADRLFILPQLVFYTLKPNGISNPFSKRPPTVSEDLGSIRYSCCWSCWVPLTCGNQPNPTGSTRIDPLTVHKRILSSQGSY
ncbi:hypothetical protein AVEN_166025-2 [Araneus ventricosus]|uniref:Uncharacterized protein n=1 Tax=Araneus ventricosus TaxID=182803 RepID=A0A4Y2L6W1_ARAVE|nr:hypothetical protein AVEN_166025-2 [Araneus ventricosus]